MGQPAYDRNAVRRRRAPQPQRKANLRVAKGGKRRLNPLQAAVHNAMNLVAAALLVGFAISLLWSEAQLVELNDQIQATKAQLVSEQSQYTYYNSTLNSKTNICLLYTSSEAEATSAEYTVYNTTGSKVTELYLYDAGSEDKGENLAGEGLADGESIVITRDVEADKQADVVYVLEFTTEDGNTQSFDTLHYEVAPISLKSVDAAAGATAIAFEAPQK